MPASDEPTTTQDLCGKWMPRAQAYCARGPGHPEGLCASPEAMERQRQRGAAAVRVYDPDASRRWRAKHRLSRYGLTQESFDRLLEIQGYACAMCREPFQDDEPIHIDHDHTLGCHPGEKQACDRCRRGLLCLRCNTALGYIEKYTDLARAYVADPPVGSGRVNASTGRWRSLGARYLDTVEATGSSPVRPTNGSPLP